MRKMLISLIIICSFLMFSAGNTGSMPAPSVVKETHVQPVAIAPAAVAAPKKAAKRMRTREDLMRDTFGQLPSDVLKDIPTFAVNP